MENIQINKIRNDEGEIEHRWLKKRTNNFWEGSSSWT
jgi:hypothetical protein